MWLFNRLSREERFWRWFTHHSERLFQFKVDHHTVVDDLNRALAQVRKGLTFEFGPVEDGRRTFIISADGNKALFPVVRQLVSAAPAMPAWQVIALRPPKNLDLVIHFGSYELGADDVSFQDEIDGQKIGLHLYIRDLNEENERALGGATFILLDNALGEYTVETQVGFVTYQPLPEDPEAHGLKPFRSIRDRCS